MIQATMLTPPPPFTAPTTTTNTTASRRSPPPTTTTTHHPFTACDTDRQRNTRDKSSVETSGDRRPLASPGSPHLLRADEIALRRASQAKALDQQQRNRPAQSVNQSLSSLSAESETDDPTNTSQVTALPPPSAYADDKEIVTVPAGLGTRTMTPSTAGGLDVTATPPPPSDYDTPTSIGGANVTATPPPPSAYATPSTIRLDATTTPLNVTATPPPPSAYADDREGENMHADPVVKRLGGFGASYFSANGATPTLGASESLSAATTKSNQSAQQTRDIAAAAVALQVREF
jgi:hypothetical protein